MTSIIRGAGSEFDVLEWSPKPLDVVRNGDARASVPFSEASYRLAVRRHGLRLGGGAGDLGRHKAGNPAANARKDRC